MATTAISVREYLATSYRPDRDYVDGAVLERNLGEKQHALLQMYLGAWFFTHRDAWQIVVLPEQRVQVNHDRFRIPDLCIVRADQKFDTMVEAAPILCIEILSREDRLAEIRLRVDDYAQMGVHDVWIIDPHARRVYVCIAGAFAEFSGGTLRISGTEIEVSVAAMWAELTR